VWVQDQASVIGKIHARIVNCKCIYIWHDWSKLDRILTKLNPYGWRMRQVSSARFTCPKFFLSQLCPPLGMKCACPWIRCVCNYVCVELRVYAIMSVCNHVCVQICAVLCVCIHVQFCACVIMRSFVCEQLYFTARYELDVTHLYEVDVTPSMLRT